jgi:hypothetical protein
MPIYRYKALDLETERYIEKISVLEDKYELYVEIRSYAKAVDVAIKLRDPYRLQEVFLSISNFAFLFCL